MVRGDKYRWALTRRMGLGRPAPPSSNQPRVWFHAVSVGEVVTAATIVDALLAQEPGLEIVLSVGTPDGLDEARRRFGDRAAVSVVVSPVDMPWAMRRLIDDLRPRVFALVETDVWPNLLLRLRRRGVPAIMINGRLSRGGGRWWRRLGGFSTRVWGAFDVCLMQSAADAARVRALGVDGHKILDAGNVKYDRHYPTDVDAAAWRRELGLGRDAPVFVAGSTHRGEERIVLQAWGRLRDISPKTRLVLAPRQPERFDEVAGIVHRAGYAVNRRSTGRLPDAPVILLDTLGELARTYALAEAAFVGGSLIVERGVGGHNLLEPAAFGVPVLFGPNMKNFAQMRDEFLFVGAGLEVADAASLARALARLRADLQGARTMGRAALSLVKRHRGATETAVAHLLKLVLRGR
ncbi:MAG: 3-deoxy-D-manno-octulosonic acid transferase [Proteobacteria bacterium]|nr:3-deoxy-D-manno-octulosonic acid transferase [Pseudomonadota bacterium]